MLAYDMNDDFVSVNSENTTPSAIYQWVSESDTHSHQQIVNDLNKKLYINLQPSEMVTSETDGSEKLVGLDKRSNDRLALLARAYGQKQAPVDQRELIARIQMIEGEMEATTPRYTKEDWELLEQFNQSIEKLTEGM